MFKYSVLATNFEPQIKVLFKALGPLEVPLNEANVVFTKKADFLSLTLDQCPKVCVVVILETDRLLSFPSLEDKFDEKKLFFVNQGIYRIDYKTDQPINAGWVAAALKIYFMVHPEANQTTQSPSA